jgi:hypothetical protein
MAGIEGTMRLQFGKETTAGVKPTIVTYWRGENGAIDDQGTPVFPKEDVGVIGGIGRSYIPFEKGQLELPETEATFEQIGYLLNMGIQGVAGVADGAGSGYVYTYPIPFDAEGSPQPYTYYFEGGDHEGEEEIGACFATKVTLKGSAEEAWKMSGTLYGWPMGPGTFTTTATIPSVEEIKFGYSTLYLDDPGDDWGTTPVEDSFMSFELTLEDIYKAVATGEGLGLHWTFIKLGPAKITLKYTLEHDATSIAERAKRRASAERAVRVMATGSTLTTSGSSYTTKTIIIDVCGAYAEAEKLTKADGNTTIPFTLTGRYNTTLASKGSIVLVNQLSALP